MIHFLPAWYHMDTWNEHEQFWYKVKEHTEFDDTVKQIQMFHRNSVMPYEILLLSHAPNFRHFLHRQGVFHAPYWSCFDGICQIKKRDAAVFSFMDLNWPEEIEFEYTSFVIVAYLKGVKYAQIEFGEAGNMILIWMYENGQLSRCNVYDDRGFISKTVVYENGRSVYQDFLMENGVRKLRYYQDGHVEINPKYPKFDVTVNEKNLTFSFLKMQYDSMDEVVTEVFKRYVSLLPDDDIFCIATHSHHNEIVSAVLKHRKTILSFFGKRYSIPLDPVTVSLIENSQYVVTDVKSTTIGITPVVKKFSVPIKEISPYDSRADFGISQQLSNQQVLLPVDELELDVFRQVLVLLDSFLDTHEKVSVNFFTREAGIFKPRTLLDEAFEMIPDTNNRDRYHVEQCIDEPSVTACMKKQRLLVNLNLAPELYLQIAALSAGIPQIVRVRTQYVRHNRNGMVLKRLEELPDALEYYLDGLANWNRAMVSAYELGKQYSTEVLLNNWKEVIESVGHSKGSDT